MEPRRWFVWQVFGYSRGSLALLATFPYREKEDAERLASETHAGYVMRAVQFTPQDMAEIHATGDKKPQPPVATIVPVPQPRAVPVPVVPVRVNVWT